MDFKISGRVHVLIDDVWSADWDGSRKTPGMLGVLLTRPCRTVSDGVLIEWLWGEDAAEQDARKLYDYVSKLRKVLNRMECPPSVSSGSGGYRVDVDPTRIDLHAAVALRDQAHRAAHVGDHEHASTLLSEALAFVGEPPLLDLRTPLAEEYRSRIVRGLILPCHYTLMACWLRLGYPEQVLHALDEIQPEHELNVTLAKRRLAALRATSRHDEADQYTIDIRRILRVNDLFDEADELLVYANALRPKTIPSPRASSEDRSDSDINPTLLPSGHSELTGRQQLLSELDARTDRATAAKVVLLTGTAGVGKTAVLVQWARQVRPCFPRGCVYFDLHGFSTSSPMTAAELVRRLLQLFETTADLLGSEQAQFDRLGALLSGRKMLLVLDNVADYQQIRPILDSASEALILVASRHHLAPLTLQYGASEVHVPKLPHTAVREWMRNTIGVRCERDSEAFNELIELTAGVPLAINIVSHYATERPASTLRDVAALLRDEHRVLDVGSSDPAATSIRASFALSYRELKPAPQRLFRLLGLHPSSTVALGAATALAGVSRQQALFSIDALVEASLIDQADGEIGLHDLLYEYAVQCASADETLGARIAATERMLDWYLASASNAEQVLFPHRPAVPVETAGTVTAAEFDNQHDAFQWHADHRETLIAAVHLAHRSGHHGHTWRLANVINEPLKRQGYYRDALDCLQLALNAVRAVATASDEVDEDRTREPGTLNNIGYIYMALSEYHTAQEYFAEAHTLFTALEEPLGIAISLHNLAYQRFRVDDLDAAERLFRRAIAVEEEHRLDPARAGTLRRLAAVLRRGGDDHGAKVLWDRALSLFEAVGNNQGTGQVLQDYAQAHLDAGAIDQAIDYGEHALTHHVRAHDIAGIAENCCLLAATYQERRYYDLAKEHARESIRICWRLGDHHTQARALAILANVLDHLGHSDAAQEGREQSQRLSMGPRYPNRMGDR